jgi:hypothetical protein
MMMMMMMMMMEMEMEQTAQFSLHKPHGYGRFGMAVT